MLKLTELLGAGIIIQPPAHAHNCTIVMQPRLHLTSVCTQWSGVTWVALRHYGEFMRVREVA